MAAARALAILLYAATLAGCAVGVPTAPSGAGANQPATAPPAPPLPAPPDPAPPPSPPRPADPLPAPDPPSPPSAPALPVIVTQPRSHTIPSGDHVRLTVGATGTAPLSYQWYAGTSGDMTSTLAGQTSDEFTTPALTTTARYWVRVFNAAGSVASDTATVSVAVPEPPSAAPPHITSHPTGATITSGGTATLSVTAAGTAPLRYQWYQGEHGDTASPVSGATSATYTTPRLGATTRYWVRVSNSAGADDSDTATVTVSALEGNDAFESAVFDLLNDRRASGATCGATVYGPTQALAHNSLLRTAARGHSRDMATHDYVSHTGLDGRSPSDRIGAAGYTGAFPLGENIAAGQASPPSVVNGWMASAGHCANIMNPAFRGVGVGYAYDSASTYRHYWTLTFGGSP